jgi:murein DD-endopeptidase MepM/ murein hydrolase activator NlpD
MIKHVFSFHFLLFTFYFSSAQLFPAKNYPQGYFRNPQNIPIKLNANFGEMRPNHFHMGLDLNTLKKENLPEYAVADGYIAKIKIEAGGFGNAIYINHPNGYTSLYAHLNEFYPALQQWVIEQQYKAQSWKIELNLTPDLFPVKKGQFIALSGNTGGSQGPHLHFEIRRTSDEACLNPLLFDFNIYDVTPPDLKRLAVYDRNQSTYEQVPKSTALVKVASGYSIPGGTMLVNSNRISFAIVATDRLTGVPNANGIYEAVAYLGDEPVSGFLIDDIDYLETRYFNAHADYKIKATGGLYYQQLTPLPGDKLTIYKKWNNDGMVQLNDTAVHQIKIIVKDANGNASTLQFKIKRSSSVSTAVNIQNDSRYMLPNQINVFERDDVQMISTEKSFYDAFRFIYNYKTNAKAYSNVHVMHTYTIPIHDVIPFRIKPNRNIPIDLQNRMLMVKAAKGKTDVSKAVFSKGWYEAGFREFGEFWLEADTIPPTLGIMGIKEGGTITAGSRIIILADDNWKEIKNFRAELDGQWLRFVQRGNHFTYKVDEHCPLGEHELRVAIEDEAGNTTDLVIRFIRK